ncbi:HAD family hydrolase [Parablautia intestinalis]|uniref:HAD family hydrolase n=1 Tax=Parablautia intestinalis TaxID=2320100 RepID=A0A3A9AIU7_9FIRM|nr:HAD family hydrolase [Parablautia intestinalis]RKI91279.1 HAD family hydrolase [Parablautia intestinalis]
MESKVIFLDIDGTLTLPGQNEPPKSAIRAIKKARERGHYVFLCTGRSYGMLLPLLKYDFDGIIASAGSYVEYQNEVLVNCPVTEEKKHLAMETLKENGIFRTVECMDGSYTDEEFKDFLRAHSHEGNNSELLRWREQIEQSLNVFPMKEYKGQPVYKIIVVCSSQAQLKKPREVLEDDFVFSISGQDEYGFINGELINKRFHKGKALRLMCGHLGIPISESIAFGDSINDKEMLEIAGLSICMENGQEQVKKIADEVCPSVLEDGIWHAFFKHKLIEN